MGKWNGNTLPVRAEEALREAKHCPRRLMLLHTGAALGIALIISALNLILSRQIDSTGGLAGLGLRSILETIQSLLEVFSSLGLPFWETGILAAAYLWATRQPAENATVLMGFRRFGPVLRLRLLQGLVTILLAMGIIYFSSMVYLMTPWSKTVVAEIETMLGSGAEAMEAIDALTPEMMGQLVLKMKPLMILCGALLLVIVVPILYRMRFAPYLQMQQERVGARAAIAESFRMTRKNCLNLLKLDLRFWWFYVLQALTIGLCYGDVILTACGIAQPWGETVGFFLFYVLGIAGQLALFAWARPKVLTTYAMACLELQGYSV